MSKEGEKKGVAGEYENQHWLDNWLRLKVKQEQKEFNETTKKEAKKNVKCLTFVQLGLKGKVVIEDFPELTQLNLSNNELEEVIIRNCPDLKLVSLAHNKLTNLKIENCPSIKELYTSYNQLTSLEETKIEELNNLLILSYDQNPLTEEEKARLDAFGLKDTAAKARVDGPAQKWLDDKYPLEERDKIEKLDISGLGLQGDLDLKRFTNLKSLDCSDNELLGINLNGCSKFEYIDCSCNDIEVILGLEKNLQLEELHANNNNLFELNLISDLTNFHILNISNNQLDKLDVSKLVNLRKLDCSLNLIEKLDLSNNLNLKTLLCYGNYLGSLEIKHLKNLKYLYCYKNVLLELDVSGLKNLKELYCANNIRSEKTGLKELRVEDCEKLEVLDCAEGFLEELNISNLPELKVISCKENCLGKLTINNCEQLNFLDFDAQHNKEKKFSNNKMEDIWDVISELNIDGSKNLRELYYPKNARNVPNWETIPSLKIVGIGEKKLVKDKEGKDKYCYFVEEIDVLAIRNTKRIQTILNNPKNYSFADLINLKGKKLHGVSTELREKLFELATKKANEELLKKLREQFCGKDYHSQKDQDKNEETPPKQDKQEDNNSPPEKKDKPVEPTPQDKDQIIRDLKNEIRRLKSEGKKSTSQQAKEIEKLREDITNSALSQEQKERLLKQLEELTSKTNNEVEMPSSTPLHYWGWLFVVVGWIVLAGLFILSLRKEKKRRY